MADGTDPCRGLSEACQVIRTRLQGWNNPRPIEVALRRDRLAALREGVARDIAALMPRCAALDRALPPRMLHHRAYVASKRDLDFTLELGPPGPTAARGLPILAAPVLRMRHAAVPAAATPWADGLARVQAMLAVGEVDEPGLAALLAARGALRLAPGNGEMVVTPSGARRPASDSLSAWLAHHDEAERGAIGAFVLGRQAGGADVALLRGRLHGHQRLLVEAGSPALTWLLAQWDGSLVRDGAVFLFAEPGPGFRAPDPRLVFAPGRDWPRISIVTVSFNQQPYLEQCIRSILDQRYPNLELIVIDAGSTDGSVEILRRHAHAFAHLVIEPDEGQSDGLNKGFRLATGEILTWVNSDDMLAPLALRRAALAFAESGADMVAGTCARVLGREALLRYRHHAALPALRKVAFELAGPLDWCTSWEKGDYFFQPEVFFTRGLWERAGGYLKRHLYWVMDWELWLRFALAGASILRIPDVLGISREHETQKTTSEEMYLWQVAAILREFDQLFARLEHDAAVTG